MNSFLLNSVGFWGHNDMDMLEIGNNLTAEESRTHFAFWAAMKSPLIIGTDLSKLNTHDLGVLLNPYLLAFNQDSKFGAPATPFKWGTNADWTFNATNPAEYWSGESSNGTLVLLLNTLKGTRSMTARFRDVPSLQSGKDHRVVDAWTGQDMGIFQDHIKVSVASKDTRAFLVQRLK
jgi:alpha-galactosidase